MNGTAVDVNCCPFDATSTATERGSYDAPERRRMLSTRCSSRRSTPVRAPIPNRHSDRGDHVLSSAPATTTSSPSCTSRPDGSYATRTRTPSATRTSDSGSDRSSTGSPSYSTSSFSDAVSRRTIRPSPMPSSPNGASGRSPTHTLTPSPTFLSPAMNRSKLASK